MSPVNYDVLCVSPATARVRMKESDWRAMLLGERDRLIIQGRLRRLVAKRLGYGVVEVTVEPLKETP